MTKFRVSARQAGVYVRVVKNTLARRAIEGTSFECMKGSLRGPLVLAFSREDPGAAARVVKGFSKEHDTLVTVAWSRAPMRVASGFNHAEGVAAGVDGPKELPAQALDHGSGQLMAAAAMLARTLKARGDQPPAA